MTPDSWPSTKLKFITSTITSGSRDWAKFDSESGSLFVRIANLDRGSLSLKLAEKKYVDLPDSPEGERAQIAQDDLLLSITAYLGSIGLADAEAVGGYVSQHIALARLDSPEVNPRWVGYCLLSAIGQEQLTGDAYGGTKVQLALDDVRNLWFPLPSLLQQNRIATYLDRETARIDALVAEKERMLDLLEQKRAALISRAVTCGLNPKAPTKPSGLEWLGEIPKHWEVRRGKFIFTQSALPVGEEDEIVTCFRDGQVTLRKNRREEGFTNAILELGYQGIRAGQLVLHSMDAFAGAIGVSDSDGKCSPEYIICDPIDDSANPYYFSVALRLMALRGYVQAACTAVRERAPRIRFSHVANMFLPLPPRSEQDEIVRYISDNRDSTAALESALRDSIALLKERRSALITAAVTGRLDITRQS